MIRAPILHGSGKVRTPVVVTIRQATRLIVAGQSAVIATLADTNAPSIPQNAHSTGKTTGSVTIVWNASSDSVGIVQSGVSHYRIRDGGVVVGSPVPEPLTQFIHSGLNPGSTHSYTVSAVDLYGNESAVSSPPVVVTTNTSTNSADFIIGANATVFDGSNASPVTGANRPVVGGDIVEFAARSAGTGGTGQAMIIRNLRITPGEGRITLRCPTTGQARFRRFAAGSGNHVFRMENCQDLDCEFLSDSTTCPLTVDGKRHGVKVEPCATGTDSPSHWFKWQVIPNPSYDPNGLNYGGCRNIKVNGLEVDGGWPARSNNGIGVSSNDHGVKASDVPGIWQEGIHFDNLYVHDVSQEGMYIGGNPYMSFVTNTIEGTGRDVPVRYAKITNFWIVNTGGEGINPKSWFGGVNGGDGALENSIHDGVMVNINIDPNNGIGAINCNSAKVDIYNIYFENSGKVSVSINVSGGTNIGFPDSDPTFSNRVYNLVIRKTGTVQSSNAIQVQHSTKTQGAQTETVPPSWYARVKAFNNSVANHTTAINLNNSHTTSFARNNLAPGCAIVPAGQASNNTTSGTLASTFQNPNGTLLTADQSALSQTPPDFHLLVPKPAIGTIGTPANDPASWPVGVDIASKDIEGVVRTQSTADCGAYEF